ncbi:Sigma factor, ECF subfamily [Nitrincola lacisaponensis]|uniref:Sigma factor, ECF subfamily n=2 Tax=Nitrincola lacisaponensis TaxID=267850 RepID=A0A063XZ45_9GAMM|nr:Sigma factor, ECF subfamily [Nitrincola lacisaponensis]
MMLKEPQARDALGLLYSQNRQWLLGWLCKRLGCSQRAADLLQDTFIRLLKRDEWQEAQEPRAYLMTVAKRVLIDHWRRERIEQAYLDALLQLPEAEAPSPETQHQLLELLLEIDRRLEGLPDLTRRTFLHAQLDGMTYAEIAQTLNISISSVKRHLIRATSRCYFPDLTGE